MRDRLRLLQAQWPRSRSLAALRLGPKSPITQPRRRIAPWNWTAPQS